MGAGTGAKVSEAPLADTTVVVTAPPIEMLWVAKFPAAVCMLARTAADGSAMVLNPLLVSLLRIQAGSDGVPTGFPKGTTILMRSGPKSGPVLVLSAGTMAVGQRPTAPVMPNPACRIS